MKKITLPVPEVPGGFPNDPRLDGIYCQGDPDIKNATVWQVTVREGSIIKEVPENEVFKDTPWWYEHKHWHE